MGVRTAVILMTAERYFYLTVNFGMIAIVARLLRPDEIGIHALGWAIFAIGLSAAREFASNNYLVQSRELTRENVRAAFTVMLILTSLVFAGLFLSAPWIAASYGEDGLVPYLRVISAALMLELVSEPLRGLMRRDMAFGQLAIINVAQTATNAVVVIALAAMGFSYMSFAWGWLLAVIANSCLSLYFKPAFWIYLPRFRGWRAVLVFGGYNGVNVFLHRLYDSVPYLFFGRILSFDAVGIYNRAVTLCQLPDKVFLSGAISVVLPHFSAEVREGRHLKQSYLNAVEYITAFQWPALIGLAVLAHPVVAIILGDQWFGAVPIIQIIALAWLFQFTAELNYPVLIALGQLRATLVRGLIIWPTSALILSLAAFWGLKAAALSMFLAIPLQAIVSVQIVRRFLKFEWRELAMTLRKSAVVTVFSAVGPMALVASRNFEFDLSITMFFFAVVLSAIGWLAGLWLTKHPVLKIMLDALTDFADSPLGTRIVRSAWRRSV